MSSATADQLRGLAEEMAAAYTQRMQDVPRIKAEAREFVGTLPGENAQLRAEADGLVKDLAQQNVELRATVPPLIQDLASQNAAIKTETDNLVKDLGQQNAELKTEADDLVKDLAQENAQMRDQFRKEHAATAAAWQDLLATMRSVRGNGHPKQEVADAKTTEEPKAAAQDIGDQLAERIQEALSPAELKERTMSLIQGRKEEGIKLASISESLGLESWLGIVPLVKELIDEGKVRKEDTLYFAE